MEYGSEVQRRFAAPSHSGEMPPDAPGLACGEAEDRALNVWVRFQLQVTDGMIRAVRYRVFGCPHTLAAAEWAADRLEGASIAVLGELDMHPAAQALGVPAAKLGKLLRIEDALAACARALDKDGVNDGDITD